MKHYDLKYCFEMHKCGECANCVAGQCKIKPWDLTAKTFEAKETPEKSK